MKALAELLIAGLELVEAEGRQLRLTAFRFVAAAALIALSAVIAAGGVVLLAVGTFLMLQWLTGHAWAAALICGIGCVLVAGAVGWIAHLMVK